MTKIQGRTFGMGTNPRGGEYIDVSGEELFSALGLPIPTWDAQDDYQAFKSGNKYAVTKYFHEHGFEIEVDPHYLSIESASSRKLLCLSMNWQNRDDIRIDLRLTNSGEYPTDGGANPLAQFLLS